VDVQHCTNIPPRYLEIRARNIVNTIIRTYEITIVPSLSLPSTGGHADFASDRPRRGTPPPPPMAAAGFRRAPSMAPSAKGGDCGRSLWLHTVARSSYRHGRVLFLSRSSVLLFLLSLVSLAARTTIFVRRDAATPLGVLIIFDTRVSVYFRLARASTIAPVVYIPAARRRS